MEVGKLVTSSPAEAARGSIFYFILDEEYPDDPRQGHQRYYYVVADSVSYTDAYFFLCHSLCDKLTGIDRNSTQLRQWYQLYVRVFGPSTYDAFVNSVAAAPRGTLCPHPSTFAKPLPVPLLCADEATARAALRELRLSNLPLSHPRHHPTQTTARVLPSCTPERRPPSRPASAPSPAAAVATATAATPPGHGRRDPVGSKTTAIAAARGAPAALRGGSPLSTGALAGEVARERLLNPPVSDTDKLRDPVRLATLDTLQAAATSPAASSVAGADNIGDVHPIHKRSLLAHVSGHERPTTARTSAPATTAPVHTGVGDAAAQELRALLADVRERAKRETAALRRDLDELRRTLAEERRSHEDRVRAAARESASELNSAVAAAGVASAREEQQREAERALARKLEACEAHAAALTETLAKEREATARDADRWQREVRQLHERLRLQSREHGERLHAVVKENEAAVTELDARVSAKEEEMRALYDDAVQSRDVRITQLSENATRAEQSARRAAAESAELRRKCEELERAMSELSGEMRQPHQYQHQPYTSSVGPSRNERQLWEQNAALSREVAAAHAEVARLQTAVSPGRDETLLRHYERLEAECSFLRDAKAAAELQLLRAQERNAHQQAELDSAQHLIDALREGLETVQHELPVLRREIYLPLGPPSSTAGQ